MDIVNWGQLKHKCLKGNTGCYTFSTNRKEKVKVTVKFKQTPKPNHWLKLGRVMEPKIENSIGWSDSFHFFITQLRKARKFKTPLKRNQHLGGVQNSTIWQLTLTLQKTRDLGQRTVLHTTCTTRFSLKVFPLSPVRAQGTAWDQVLHCQLLYPVYSECFN